MSMSCLNTGILLQKWMHIGTMQRCVAEHFANCELHKTVHLRLRDNGEMKRHGFGSILMSFA